MTLHLRAALCCLVAVPLAGCATFPGFADRLWSGLEPQLIPVINTAILALVGGAIGAAGTAGAKAFAAIHDEKLVQSLYRTMENGLRSRFVKKIEQGGALKAETLGSAVATATDLADVLTFTKENNAKAVRKLKQSDDALIEKIRARAPKAKAEVVAAEAAVTSVAPL